MDPASQEGLGAAVNIQPDLPLNLFAWESLDFGSLGFGLGHDSGRFFPAFCSYGIRLGLHVCLVGQISILAQVYQLLAAFAPSEVQVGVLFGVR